MANSYSFCNVCIHDSAALLVSLKSTFPDVFASIQTEPTLTTIFFTGSLASNQQTAMSNLVIAQAAVDSEDAYLWSVGNSSTTALSANQSFTGIFEPVLGYHMIQLQVHTNAPSTTNGLVVSLSNSVLNTVPHTRTFTIASNVKQDILLHIPTGVDYAKVSLTNGAQTSQSFLHLGTSYLQRKVRDRPHVLNETMLDNDICSLTKCTIGGKSLGTYYQTEVTSDNKLAVDIPMSAFGLVKVQEDTPKIQVNFPYGINPAVCRSILANQGTVTWNSGFAILSTGAATSSSAFLRSRRIFKYAAGQGGNVMFTAIYGNAVAGNRKLVGCGTAINGFFFGYNDSSSEFAILRRSAGTEYWTYRSQWNVDRMDGTGPSKQVIDFSKGNVFRINYQWLGFGAINYYIEESTTGRFMLVHRETYANNNLFTSVQDPSFQMYTLCENKTNNTDVQLKVACFAGMLEGDVVRLGLTFGIDNLKTVSGTTVLTNILTIRSKALYNGFPHHVPVSLTKMSMGTEGLRNVVVYILLNATVAGTLTWTDVDTNSSVVEYNTTGTDVTGGRQLSVLAMGKNDARDVDLSGMNIHLEPNDTMTIAAKVTANGSSDVVTSFTWYEDV